MKIYKFLFTVFVTVIVIFPFRALPCTTFCFLDGKDWIYGRNYDWDTGNCLITVNKRGVAKTAYNKTNPAKWVSKYGSITFNQYGREFPLGGMNETGLVIECMWLQQTQYPQSDSRAELNELQWIQYQLDNCASVDDIIASDKIIRIPSKDMALLHFLVCDSKGQAAVIEFLGGKMAVYRNGKNLPASALANNTYAQSIRRLKSATRDKQSGAFDTLGTFSDRFLRAVQGIREWENTAHGSAINHAFEILKKVTVRRTMFSIVYDVKNRYIYFKTKGNPKIRFFNFNGFQFDCHTPVKILDISSSGKGDVTASFSNYTFEANIDLIRKTYSETRFTQNVPEDKIRQVAHYPETLTCVSTKDSTSG
jgi:penicillin V acylase-like amidase (Ntn superfamily)